MKSHNLFQLSWRLNNFETNSITKSGTGIKTVGVHICLLSTKYKYPVLYLNSPGLKMQGYYLYRSTNCTFVHSDKSLN